VGLGIAVAACALVAVPGQAVAKQGVILKPKPGQQITHHPVRLVVHAGPEITDLKARLNGVPVSRDFLVRRRGRRVLAASSSHGLRHGRNLLTVIAYTRHGTRIRRAKVRFNVAHKRPLAGAGRDRRIVRRSPVKLKGRSVEHPRGPSGDRVRWKIVQAPRGSRLRRKSHAKLVPGAGRFGLKSTTTRSPIFKPDVIGTYRLEITVGTGAGQTSDRVNLNAVPRSPLVQVHTQVSGGPNDESKRPAIQVGNQTYLAPYMATVGGVGYYSDPNGDTSPSGPGYEALFHVVVLNRTTLETVANRTYGWCRSAETGREFVCRMNDAGNPVPVGMDVELSAEGSGSLVIANSLPAAGSPTFGVEVANQALNYLPAIGFPRRADEDFANQVHAAAAGDLSVIGIPGLDPGEADLSLHGGMDGWLTPDRNSPEHYGFMPAERVPFDTRSTSEPICNNNGCTVAQTVGPDFDKDTQTHTEQVGGGGFLVSIYDRSDLSLVKSDYFRTIGGQPGAADAETLRMTSLLESENTSQPPEDESRLVLITSVHGPNLQPPLLVDTDATTWQNLAEAVAYAGGTYHRFHTAASTSNSDYTLIGFGGAGEGHGVEAIGPNARVRGALVPDDRSQFSPVNVSDYGAPPEQLMKIILQAPGKLAWPGEAGSVWTDSTGNPYAGNNTPGTRAAIEYIGESVGELGADPRAQYWLKGLTMDTDDVADKVAAVLLANYKGQTPISKQEFADAQMTLKAELGWVGTVKEYLGNLSAPSLNAANELWVAKDNLADSLANSLDDLDHEAEVEVDLIEGAFGIVANLVDLGSVAAAVKDLEKAENALLTTAAVFELAVESVAVTWDGSSATTDPDQFRVTADEIATKVYNGLNNTAKSFQSFFHIIVSDYDKLQLVGLHGGCAIGDSFCQPPYDEFAYSDDDADALNALTTLTQKRMIYMHLLPYAYPVWDTGLAYSCFEATCSPDSGPPIPFSPESGMPTFGCSEDDARPFPGAPRLAYFSGIEQLDAGHNTWRTWLSVGRRLSTYGFADESVYDAMFTPVDTDDVTNSKTLGIDQLDYMMAAHESLPFVPQHDCGWSPGPP
jgi:hypothetical protein